MGIPAHDHSIPFADLHATTHFQPRFPVRLPGSLVTGRIDTINRMNDAQTKLIMFVAFVAILALIIELVIRRSSDPSRQLSFRTRIGIYAPVLVLLVVTTFFPSLERPLIVGMFVLLVLLGILAVGVIVLLRIGMSSTNRVFNEATVLSERGRDWEAIALLEDYRKKAKRMDKSFEAVVLVNIAGLHVKGKEWAKALASI